MKHRQNIEALLELSPDFIGFIFFEKSSRHAQGALDISFINNIPETVQKVGVFVNEEMSKIEQIGKTYHLDVIQLHGKETPETCKVLKEKGYKIFKVFGIADEFDFEVLKPYEPYVDYFLFDTKSKKHGGTGKTFDWRVLEQYNSEVPFFLSGGVSLENIEEVKQLNIPQLKAIDVNSKFEIEPALKDIQLIKKLKSHL